MPYTIEPNKLEQFVIRLVDEPPFVHALEMAPANREPMLSSGDWIVLAFAVWSRDDLQSVPLAIEFAKSLGGTINLGLRPFEFAEEFPAWCDFEIENSSFREIDAEQIDDELHVNITGNAGATPVWFCLRGGTTLGQHQGVLDADELQRFTRKCFAMN